MQRLVFRRSDDDLAFARHAREIRAILAAQGYEISLRDLHDAWEAYSDTLCASWMNHTHHAPGEILAIVLRYCETPDAA